jgi:hypothetical protein
MRMIFDGLVEEFRAWHLFEEHPGNSPQRDLRELSGMSRPGYNTDSYRDRGYRGPGYADPGFGAAGSAAGGSGGGGCGTPEYDGPGYGTPEYGDGDYDWAGRRGRDAGRVPRPGGPR